VNASSVLLRGKDSILRVSLVAVYSYICNKRNRRLRKKTPKSTATYYKALPHIQGTR
jgi:hypothetical protein